MLYRMYLLLGKSASIDVYVMALRGLISKQFLYDPSGWTMCFVNQQVKFVIVRFIARAIYLIWYYIKYIARAMLLSKDIMYIVSKTAFYINYTNYINYYINFKRIHQVIQRRYLMEGKVGCLINNPIAVNGSRPPGTMIFLRGHLTAKAR